MFLQNLISHRIDNNTPVKVALIGAGKFGSMFLSQVPTTPGLEVVIIADLIPDNAKKLVKMLVGMMILFLIPNLLTQELEQ